MGQSRTRPIDGTSATRRPVTTLVVGGGRTGLGIAAALARDGRPVTFVGEDVLLDADHDLRVLPARITDASAFRSVLDEVGAVDAVVAVGPDSEAFLVAHLARLVLPDATVVALVDDPCRRDAFDALDVQPLATSTVMAAAIRDRLQEPIRE